MIQLAYKGHNHIEHSLSLCILQSLQSFLRMFGLKRIATSYQSGILLRSILTTPPEGIQQSLDVSHDQDNFEENQSALMDFDLPNEEQRQRISNHLERVLGKFRLRSLPSPDQKSASVSDGKNSSLDGESLKPRLVLLTTGDGDG